MRRLPIRLRLTLAFALVMAVVLSLTGLFLYLRVGSALDSSIDQRLREREQDVAALVRSGGDISGTEGFVQVVGPAGTVAESTQGLRSSALTPAELSRARTGQVLVERALPGQDDPLRFLAGPVELPSGEVVVVVGSSTEPRGEALETLLTQLLIGGPLALLLASLGGYGLATAALRPVESMRREAEAVSASEPGRRLPLPPARDELGRLGETLNGMLERLEAALARERRFVADASHELRTPLASLRTELELALRRERTREELAAAVRSAAEETDRLSNLADDLLVLARAEDGNLPLRRERLAAADLLGSVNERYAGRAAARGRSLAVRADDARLFSADRLRLEQALGNLVENALGHGDGAIVLSVERENGRVELHVHDEGPGFGADFVGRAFEPFARGDPARSSHGAGLGLAIVDAIARAHGGAAHVENVENGADVWIELPEDG